MPTRGARLSAPVSRRIPPSRRRDPKNQPEYRRASLKGLRGRLIGLVELGWTGRGSAPQADAAGQAVGVRDDRDIRRQRESDIFSVAATEIEVVEADDLAEDLDHLLDPLVPGFLAFFLMGGIADILVIGLVAADRMMRELEMRHQFAVAK